MGKGAGIMIITRLEATDKSKVNVYLDDRYEFWLYQKELEQLGLQEGAMISEEVYVRVFEDPVSRRAKEKALSILKFSDRTEQELRKKLSEAGYTDHSIDRAIEYVTGYGYLNDERLASSYTRARMNKKSKLMIKMELMQKGVSTDAIDHVFSEEYSENPEEDPELDAIRKAISKKVREPEKLGYEEKQKLIASLYRKGFDISKIKHILE